MKKYPITYKGKEYEVRWEKDFFITYVTVYKVKKILGIKFYTQVYYMDKYNLEEYLNNIGIYREYNTNYHIEEVKYLFNLMKLHITEKGLKTEREKEQKKKLKEWDGFIDEK